MYIGCIVYAYDILLISASVVQLQQMLDLCSSCADDLDIILTIRNQIQLNLAMIIIRTLLIL